MNTTTFTCPVERWHGTLTVKTDVNYDDKIVFDDSVKEAEQFLGKESVDRPGFFTIVDVNRYNKARLPGLLRFVVSHTLYGLPVNLSVDNFPATPPIDAAMLFSWLRDCISKVMLGLEDEKKELS